MAERVERRLAAILAADVVGYSRLMDADEEATLAALNSHLTELVEPKIAEHQGRIVKLMGDGVLAEFPSAVDAVRCALMIQRGMPERNADVSEEKRIVFRIGINVGDAIIQGDDIHGGGVNVAARLEGLADPGSILISGTAYDQVEGKVDCDLEFVGEQEVKNIDRAVRTYRARLDGQPAKSKAKASVRHLERWGFRVAVPLLALVFVSGVWWFWPAGPPPSGKPSIAVLPFDNLGGDEATGRLANGLTEDIITDLARFGELDVIARNSTEVYKDAPVDIRQVGKDLSVRYVLEGSVQREGNRIRATAQLLDTDDGAHLWSERWDRPAENLFAVQTEIAEEVAGRLGGYYSVISDAELTVARRARPKDLTAYDLWLQAREASRGAPPESTYEAIRLLEQAVEKDPTFARAWTGLAHEHDYTVSFGADPDVALKAARDAAERAVELDPMDADAHLALANALVASGDLPRAKVEFETALRLNPGAAHILTVYSSWAATFGEPERGLEAAERAIRLDPNHPVWAANYYRGAYFGAGRYEKALQMVEQQPTEKRTRFGWVQRAASYGGLGRVDKAKAAVEDVLARYPDLTIQAFVSGPDWGEADRQHHIETMRKAGFPPCAESEQLAELEKPAHLPECEVPSLSASPSKNER